MLLGSQVNQPDPETIVFSTATRACFYTAQFPLPIGQSVTFKLKSPNVADSNVWVRACLYEVGIFTLRDEIATLLGYGQRVTNVYDDNANGIYPYVLG